MPTAFARQTERAMLALLDYEEDDAFTVSFGSDATMREYRLTHQSRRNTRKMLREDAR